MIVGVQVRVEKCLNKDYLIYSLTSPRLGRFKTTTTHDTLKVLDGRLYKYPLSMLLNTGDQRITGVFKAIVRWSIHKNDTFQLIMK